VGGVASGLRQCVTVEVVAPVEHGVVIGEHTAAVSFRRRAPSRVAGEPELALHGRAEEGQPGHAHRVEELPWDAVPDHVEGAPVRARGADGVGRGGGREVDDRDGERGGAVGRGDGWAAGRTALGGGARRPRRGPGRAPSKRRRRIWAVCHT
jgi:hypothetical protein